MTSRNEALEFALLGLLANEPLHGYELRKRVMTIFGPFRGIAFSVIYPQLHRMVKDGLISESLSESFLNRVAAGRKKIVYTITAAGQIKFTEIAKSAHPKNWDDESFEVRFAFFGPTPVASRLRILEGRQRRLKDKREVLLENISNIKDKDKYLIEWKNHLLNEIESEIVWLNQMITMEEKTK